MINVKGYSGCSIRIVRGEDNEYIVEKSTSDPNYVSRLLKQRDKQVAAFLGNTHPNVSIPCILYTRVLNENKYTNPGVSGQSVADAGYAEGNRAIECVIGMNFIHHTDAVSYLAKTSISNIISFTNIIMEVLQMEIDNCDDDTSDLPSTSSNPHILNKQKLSPVPITIITDKIKDIVRILKSNKLLSMIDEGCLLTTITDIIVPYLVEYIEKESVNIDGYGQCIRLPIGTCHGDLTLSNILVVEDGDANLKQRTSMGNHRPPSKMRSVSSSSLKSEQSDNRTHLASKPPPQIILIDFLDSFIETPLLDMVKLAQDLNYGWTLRIMGNVTKPHTQPPEVSSITSTTYNEDTYSEEIIINRRARVNALKAQLNKNNIQGVSPDGSNNTSITLCNQLSVFSAMEYIFSEMEKRFSHLDWYKRYFFLFFIINQLRVLQYVKDIETASYLYASVKKEFDNLVEQLSKNP